MDLLFDKPESAQALCEQAIALPQYEALVRRYAHLKPLLEATIPQMVEDCYKVETGMCKPYQVTEDHRIGYQQQERVVTTQRVRYQTYFAAMKEKASAPIPFCAATLIVSRLVQAIHSFGCGSCSGFGSTLRQGMEKPSPS